MIKITQFAQNRHMTYPPALFILITILIVIFIAVVFVLLRMLRGKALMVNTGEDKNIRESLQSFDLFAREIKSLREQLAIQERLATLGEVSAGIAHELRNPMMVITGNARLLIKSLTNPEQIELSVGILKEVEEINRIIEELLQFAHGSRHEVKEIDIIGLIKDILRYVPEGDRVQFNGDRPLLIWGDEQLLKQALKNIINNALDAGSKVSINIDKTRINDVDALDIHVIDNGKGLTEQEISKVFLPFYSTKESGFGMGLTLVQKIALEHGGSVRVKSQLGKGSQFTLSLPLRK